MKYIFIFFLNLFSIATFGQSEYFNYSRKACFTNLNGQLYFDTNTNSVYSQIYLSSSVKIRLNGLATSKQKRLILAHSENAGTGVYYSKPNYTNQYILTSTFKLSNDSFKLVNRQIENHKGLYLKEHSNITTSFIIEDSSEFWGLRKSSDSMLLKFIPDNHVIIQTIYKDINGDSKDEVLLASMTVYIGETDVIAKASGPEEYLIQLLSKTEVDYETVFSYSSTPSILKYVDLIKPKGQTRYSIILYGEGCWRDCHPEIQIITNGNGSIEDCEQKFSY